MTVHFLVEGPSESALLARWAPRILKGTVVRVHPHQGKGKLPANLSGPPAKDQRGLLDQLPAKLRGFANAQDSASLHVVVLVDADNDAPDELVAQIESAAKRVAPELRVTVRLAVEETEAFYLGDLKALKKAYPQADMKRAQAYGPDSICGTWERFGEVIGDVGGNKVAWAEAMGPLLTTKASASRSPSFQSLIRGLIAAPPSTPKAKPRKPYRHPTKKMRERGKRRHVNTR
jgi:hypothetical protein